MIFAVALDVDVTVVVPFFHPANVYPVLVGVHNVPHAVLYVFVIVFDEQPEPPLSLYFNVYELAFHCAVTFIFAVALDVDVTVVVPFFHPANVYPVFVGVHNVPHSVLYFFVIVFDEQPVPPLSS